MKQIILSNEWVIKSVEINEPIPIRREPKQYRGPVERGRDWRRPLRVGKVGPAEDVDVLGGAEDGTGLDGEGEGVAVGLGRESVEVEEVVVLGVVDGVEQAEDPARVTGGSGDEVGDGGWGRVVVGRVGGEDGAVGLGVGEEKRVGSGRAGGKLGRGGGGGGEREDEEEREEGGGEDDEEGGSGLVVLVGGGGGCGGGRRRWGVLHCGIEANP